MPIPHGPEILTDSGIESLVWVCPYCGENMSRDLDTPAPQCRALLGPEEIICNTTMVPGVLVARTTIYKPYR